MTIVDLTHPMVNGLPHFPSDPQLSIAPYTTISQSGYNLSLIVMGSHQGTHLDAMSHFVPDGKTINQMPLEWFRGPARILRIPKSAGDDLTRADFEKFEKYLLPESKIIYETGWHKHFGSPQFFNDFPSMTVEAAHYLASRKIRMLGMDTPTPGRDYYELHHALLRRPQEIVVVEALANLDKVPDEFHYSGFPLNLNGRDGSPIRAVAEF